MSTTNNTVAGLAEKLLPCPFCGGADNLLPTSNGHDSAYIECANCGASGPATTDDHEPAAWNRRASPAPSAGVGVEGWVSVADGLPPVDTMVQVRLAGGMNGESLAIGESTRKSGTRDELEWTITSGGLYRYWGQQCDGGSVTHWRRLAPFTPPAAAPSVSPAVEGGLREYEDGVRRDVIPQITEQQKRKARGAARLLSGAPACESCERLEVALASQIEITNRERELAEGCARRLATAEQPGSAVQGEVAGWRGINHRTGAVEICAHTPSASVIRDFNMRPLAYATPPPAPAAEQEDSP